MNKTVLLVATVLGLGFAPAFAQFGMGGGAQGPRFDGAMDKLFGDARAFACKLEIQTSTDSSNFVTMPGAFSFDSGKTRFEVNLGDVQGSPMPADAAQQLKSMGMDTTIFISRPDLKLAYMVYPGLNSYAELPAQDSSASVSPDDFKIETSELGKETVDGHECAKNKATVTDKDGNKHEFTVWNAGDLKNFPVKITTENQGRAATMSFKNVAFTKPAASLFEAPAGLTKYDNVQTMMQTEMMKKMGMGGPPAQH